jgi:hypothetical protein
MKKIAPFILLVAVCLLLILVIYGCGTSTQTATTTSTTAATVSATELGAAKTGVLVASGGSSVGSSATSVGSAAGARIMSIRPMAGGPPSSFFSPVSADGYMSPTSESIGGNMTPYMRLLTKGGDVVNAAFLAAGNKKITKWLTLEVADIMGAGEGNSPAGMSAEVQSLVTRYAQYYLTNGTHPFNDSSFFRAISTEADYMAWMFMYPTIESSISRNLPGGVPHLYMATPEVTASQKIGGMQMKMVFANTATGEITLIVSTETQGKPISGTYSGRGTLTTAIGSLETTLIMGFTTDGPPSSLKVIGTTETTPKYTVIINMSPTTMTATGEVLDSGGTRIGTLEGTPTGGRVYIGASSEAFSF